MKPTVSETVMINTNNNINRREKKLHMYYVSIFLYIEGIGKTPFPVNRHAPIWNYGELIPSPTRGLRE